jgi:hypothetical protein
MHLVLRLRGGFKPEPTASDQPEMGLATGGVIKQTIIRDPGRTWRKSETKTFNVQIINSLHFQDITGERPPNTPIDARTYVQLGYPFYSIYEEPSDIAGNFEGIKSIGQMNGFKEPSLFPKVVGVIQEGKGADKISEEDTSGSGSKDTTGGSAILHDRSAVSQSPVASAQVLTMRPDIPLPRVGFWNSQSPVAEFRDILILEKEIKQHGATLF